MKPIYFFAILIAFTFYSQQSIAQDSLHSFKPKSVSAEELVGHKRQYLQLLVNKVFIEETKTGLFSISSYAADYKENLNNNEFQNTTLIYHQLYKGFSINSGVSFTSIEGLRNFIGLQYMYQNKKLSFIYLPAYYFTNGRKFSNLALIEYTPSLNKNWSLYSRLQIHYNHNLKTGNHFRSYAYSRIGLTYKYLSFGIADNYDCYGADKTTKNNYGVFLKLSM